MKSNGKRFGRIYILLLIAWWPAAVLAGQPEIDSLSNLLLDPGLNQTQRVRIKIELSRLYSTHDPKEAYRETDEALSLCQQTENEALKAEVLVQLGVLLYQNSLYDSSIYTFKQVIGIAERRNLQSILARAQMNIANNYLDLARFNLALDYYLKALTLCRQLPNPAKTEASIIANIANVYSNKEEFEKALEYSKKHLGMVKNFKGQYDEIAVAFFEVADAFQNYKNLKDARLYVDSGAYYLSRCSDRYTFCLYNQIAGDLAFDQESYEAAEKFYKGAIEEAQQINYTMGVADVFLRSGKNYIKLQKLKEAETSFKTASAIGTQIKTYQVISDAERELGDLYLMQNRFKEAAAHFKLHSQYTDSASIFEKNNLTLEMQTRFEIQEKAFELEKVQQGKDQEIKIQQIYTIVSIVIAIFFLGFAIFEFFRYRGKQQLNQELLKLNKEIVVQKNELEQQAETLSLLSKEIEEKNKLLEKENEEKSDRLVEYAFYNAHGLRSAVSNIKGLINLMKLKFHKEEEIESIVYMLDKSSENLDDIVIDFGKKLVAHKYTEDEPFKGE